MSTLFVNERVNTSKWIKGNWSTHLSLSNIPRKEVSVAQKRNKPEMSQARRRNNRNSSYKKQFQRRKFLAHAHPNTDCTALHATHSQWLPYTCTARGYHPLVDLIPSTLRRDLRSLSEIPSTLRRNLRSIAVSFFLPCEHNNRKADRIAFLNSHIAKVQTSLFVPVSCCISTWNHISYMYISVCFSYYIFMWRRSTDDSHKKTLWNLTFFIFAVVMSAQFIYCHFTTIVSSSIV